jgi:hypothetical protein
MRLQLIMKELIAPIIGTSRAISRERRVKLTSITNGLNELTNLISNGTRESIKQKAESLQCILVDALLHGMRISFRRRSQRIIFNNLNLLLNDLIIDINGPKGEDNQLKRKSYYVRLRFLQYQFSQNCNIAVDLDTSMCESEPTLNFPIPPHWHKMLFLVTPICLFFYFSGSKLYELAQNPLDPFVKSSPCGQQISGSEIGWLDPEIIAANGAKSEYLKRIEWTYDALPLSFNRINPSASEIATTFEFFLKQPNEGNQSRNNKTNMKSRNVIANNLPWIRILANNERIDHIKKNDKQSTVNIFNVLLLIPFNPFENNSPPALSLGILKGIDLAQSRLITLAETKQNKSNSTNLPKIINLIKVKILDKDIAVPSDKASRHILDLVYNGPIVGIAGLKQDTFENLYKHCPNDYKNIPVITGSIRYSRELTKDIPELTLLPSLREIAESILNDIIKRRGDDTDIKAKPENLIVVYDQYKSSSDNFANLICDLVQGQYKNYFPKCKFVEINSNNPKGKQDLRNFNENNNNELILTVNPFEYADRKKIKEFISDFISSFVQSKAKTGWMYVSPYFMDKLLEDHIVKKACTQVDNQECSQVKSEFYFIRVAPMDWRTASTVFPGKDLFAKIKDPYGKYLNWSTINSYNNFMALHELIDKAVSISESQDFSGRQVVAEIRTKISAQLRESEYEFENTVAGKIKVEVQGSEKLTRGDDIKILPAKIQILPLSSVGSKSQ